MKTSKWIAPSLIVAVFVVGACNTTPKTTPERAEQTVAVNAAIAKFKSRDPGMAKWFDDAYGYAVLPAVGKGAAGVGGAFGRGQVFDNGAFIGYCKMTQATLGLALGGQRYSEVVFFKDKDALDRFAAGKLEFAAQASAIAVRAGASSDAAYSNGVAVFTMPIKGAMFEAALGGQRFTFEQG